MTAHVDEESIEEDDLNMPVDMHGRRCKIRELETKAFYCGLLLTFSVLCNAILIVRFML